MRTHPLSPSKSQTGSTFLSFYTSEQVALLHIFSYSVYTMLDIRIFDEVKSALSNCYLPKSNLILRDNHTFLLTMTATGLCDMIFVPLVMQNMTLQINGRNMVMNLAKFLESYKNAVEGALTLSSVPHPVLEDINLMVLPFHSAQLQFITIQGGREVEFYYPI